MLGNIHFHDVVKYEKISPKESVDIKEFRLKWGIWLPVIRWDVAMVTVLIQKLAIKNKLYFNSIHTGKSLQGKLWDKLTKFPFLTHAL